MTDQYFITLEKYGDYWQASANVGGRVMVAEGETLKQAHDGIFILMAERAKA